MSIHTGNCSLGVCVAEIRHVQLAKNMSKPIRIMTVPIPLGCSRSSSQTQSVVQQSRLNSVSVLAFMKTVFRMQIYTLPSVFLFVDVLTVL